MKSIEKNKWYKNINWPGALFLILTPIAALILVPTYIYQYGVTWKHFLVLSISFMIFNMAITCGYHRYFSHRSYEAHPIVQFFYVLFGSGAFQSSILTWCTDHRRHHLKVDTDLDPYSINKGFWFAHFGWMLVKDPYVYSSYPKDLTSSKLVMNQHKYYPIWAFLVGFGLPALFGQLTGIGWFAGFLFGGLLRVVLTQHSTFLVNSVAHTFGSQPYSNKHTARDSFLVAILTFGEGYHNYHHEFQSDYRSAVKWYQWDPSKWTIRILWLLGLVKKLKVFSDYEILVAKMQMETQRLSSQGKFNERIESMKLKVEQTQRKIKHMMTEYQKVKQIKSDEYKLKYETLKTELAIAKLEFKASYRQFWIYAKALKTTEIA